MGTAWAVVATVRLPQRSCAWGEAAIINDLTVTQFHSKFKGEVGITKVPASAKLASVESTIDATLRTRFLRTAKAIGFLVDDAGESFRRVLNPLLGSML